MTDLSLVIVIVLMVALVITPIFLVLAERFIVIAKLENIKDIVDLAIDSVVIELKPEYLSYGELELIKKNYEDRVKEYLEHHLINFKTVKIKTKKTVENIHVTAQVKCLFYPRIFRTFLPKEAEYEIVREYELLVDR